MYKPFIIFNDNRQSTKGGRGLPKNGGKNSFFIASRIENLKRNRTAAELWIGNRELEIDAPRRTRERGYGKGRGSVAGKWKITKY